MIRVLVTLATFIFSTTVTAGVIELSFPYGKENTCTVTAQYWDGAHQAYTCTKEFRGTHVTGRNDKAYCSGNNSIDNLQHKDSRLDISSNGKCAKTYLTNLLGEFKVSQTGDMQTVRHGSWFLNGTKGADHKFNNSVRNNNSRQSGWGAIDLRRFSQKNQVQIHLNREYAICVKEMRTGCKVREEAVFTEFASE